MVAICLAVVGCSGHRDLTEYSLDKKSFDSEAMAKIKQESGINLPGDAKGLAFLHINGYYVKPYLVKENNDIIKTC